MYHKKQKIFHFFIPKDSLELSFTFVELCVFLEAIQIQHLGSFTTSLADVRSNSSCESRRLKSL